MARDISRTVSALREMIGELARQRDEAVRESARSKADAERLRQELDDCRRERDLARMEVDYLTVSHRLADDPDHLISARRRLQRLIAKIDRCVSLLKDDADIC